MRPDIRIDDYDYPLPEERIAKYPLANRDDSKLLVNTTDTFRAVPFKSVTDFLPDEAVLVFNNTKVVPARLFFKRDSGAIIEIFCLEPYDPNDYAVSFAQTEKCRWKCIVGNLKRWKSGFVHFDTEHFKNSEISSVFLTAELIERVDNTVIVEFTWKGGFSFSKVMELCGKMPIPPYLNRETQPIDYTRYQTAYARREGSVAAPTAGLHFTKKELDDIDAKGLTRCELCLHVGAGTFLPVKSEHIRDHIMHSEPFSVPLECLKTIRRFVSEGKNVITVGTTSTRCLESLYFIGVHCIENGDPGIVEQWEPYRDEGYAYSALMSIDAIINYMENNRLNELISRTSLIIVPGYKFKFIDYIMTNFHQPKSTLLLLIAAMIGERWRDMYRFALDNGFRFLSYGDSSLIKITNK